MLFFYNTVENASEQTVHPSGLNPTAPSSKLPTPHRALRNKHKTKNAISICHPACGPVTLLPRSAPACTRVFDDQVLSINMGYCFCSGKLNHIFAGETCLGIVWGDLFLQRKKDQPRINHENPHHACRENGPFRLQHSKEISHGSPHGRRIRSTILIFFPREFFT